MDTAQWPEGIGVVGKPPLQVVGNSSGQVGPNSNVNNKATANGGGGGGGGGSGSRPQIKAQASNCPRCYSSHTKFCYYNNYSLSQPRFFCKTCRRYWTEGGSLRNVPVGGGSRKNKRNHSSSSSSSSSVLSKIKTANDSQNPNSKIIFREGQDLNLAYPPPMSMPKFAEFPCSTTSSTSYLQDQLMNVGTTGIRGFSSFMSMFNPLTSSDSINILPAVYSSSTSSAISTTQLPSFQELFSKTTSGSLDFSHALIGNTTSDHQQHQELMLPSSGTSNNEKLFFPFENLKHEQPGILHDSSSNTPQELMEQQMSIRATESPPPHQLTSTGSYTWNNINGAGTASW